MEKITLVVLSAGGSTRFEHSVKKQWLRVADEPVWLFVTNRLSKLHNFDQVIVVSSPEEISYMENFSDDFTFVAGGNSRQESMQNALKHIDSDYVMFTDVARTCIPDNIILDLIENKNKAKCIVPALSVNDTVILNGDTINRDDVKLIQTPQLSHTKTLKKALDTSTEFTDDSSAIKALGEDVYYIQGSTKSAKLTFGSELSQLDCLENPSEDTFIGSGYDIHKFEEKKPMVLGGVQIPCEFGFKAHSDGDVLIHSVIDALLGAIGAGDIGEFFPDTDPKYKNANSQELLKYIVEFVQNVGYEIVNIDVLVLAEVPKLNPYKKLIKEKMASLLGLPKQKVNIKATTAEKMGFIGREEGVAVQSVASCKYYDWRKSL
jgi:2-C-methyl-D-erythritol 4-phosphate cytidylyltransferase/2-C-methyl-D-erythritol 2,4-cyclodiphosphate synthase